MRSRVRLLLSVILAAAGLFASGIATADPVRWMFFNGDILLPAAYVHSLLHHPGTIIWFQLPRIPSFFPDIVLVMLLSIVISSWQIVSLFYAVISFTVLVLMCSLIVARIAHREFLPSAATFVALTVLAMLLDLQIDNAGGAYFYVLFPVIHSGSFIVALGELLLVRRLIDKFSVGLGITAVVVTAVCILSDRIFIGVFIIPATAGILMLLTPIRRDPAQPIGFRRALPVLMILAVGCAAGVTFDHLLFGHVLLRDPDFPIDVPAQLNRLSALIRDPSVRFEAACAALILLLPIIGVLRSREGRFWWTVSATTVAGTLTLLPFVFVNSSATRYAQPVWWWTLMFLTVAAVRIAPRGAPFYATGAAIVFTIFTSCIRVDLFKPALVTQWRDPVERCLIKLHDAGIVHAGIAQYWIARPLEASSNWKMQVVQVTENGWVFRWQNNISSYGESPDDPHQLPNFDFLVTARLNMAVVGARFGTPTRVVPCAGTEIWIYNDSRRFRRSIIGADSWARRDGLLDASVWFGPGDLLTRTGPLPPSGIVPAITTVDPSVATWGPYIALRPGSWRLELRYQLAGNIENRDQWDIQLNGSTPFAARGSLEAGSHDKSITFEVPKNKNMMELRTSIAAGDQLKLLGFILCPITTAEAMCRPESSVQDMRMEKR